MSPKSLPRLRLQPPSAPLSSPSDRSWERRGGSGHMPGNETNSILTSASLFSHVPTTPVLLDETRIVDCDCMLSVGEVHEVLDQAWADIRTGRASGAKSVMSLSEATFWQEAGYEIRPSEFTGERLGWKLSCLYGVNPRFAGVKVIGANAFNRVLGLPRSRSTFILMEKFSMQPLAIVDATRLSAGRTGAYASQVLRLCLAKADRINVFLFGAGPIAGAILASLAHSAGERIARVHVRARRLESAKALQASLSPKLPFEIVAVEDNRFLADADFVITATNSVSPVFADGELRRDACLLHLGGDEVPVETLRRILRQGHLGCDDLETVSRRNSQSLALQYSKAGTTLEALGPHLGILELSKTADWGLDPGSPVSVTCVGLPMLDLYVVAALYEKYLAAG
ncbi:ornithine cyclodeaminase [Rhizobium rhizophilum]|uniref:Ornithine cyclodeaminase n=2 Tax=Rhizobium rhizophilum TaxID=1850373 RepID=A0ABY2QSB1_9HYPH|nr:ornithine cyclodeaminase [Rhizobium rhizophilum]